MKRILITGGAGFIGSHFVDLLTRRHDEDVVVIDKLTYAGSLANLSSSQNSIRFIEGDICCVADLESAFAGGVDWIVHFAAETHVDSSIEEPMTFADTNLLGTLRLLQFAVEHSVDRFVLISTDEVYGSRVTGYFEETDAHLPSSPYAATKSGAEKLAWSYYVTYRLPLLITRSSNNYGPRQHPEKFIPKCIGNALTGKKIPVYGTGENERDWLYVKDNCRAIDLVLREGEPGTAYNIASGWTMPNIQLSRKLMRLTGAPHNLIEFVEDRKGHDFRYAISTDRIEALGWQPRVGLDEGLKETIEWYRDQSGLRS